MRLLVEKITMIARQTQATLLRRVGCSRILIPSWRRCVSLSQETGVTYTNKFRTKKPYRRDCAAGSEQSPTACVWRACQSSTHRDRVRDFQALLRLRRQGQRLEVSIGRCCSAGVRNEQSPTVCDGGERHQRGALREALRPQHQRGG